ncbi:hypothetical protein D3C77_444500 [compost metagenome]
MTGLDQRAEMLDEQRAEQGGDVQTVGVGVGQDADLAVTQLAHVGRAGIDADGHGNVVHFLAGQHFAAVDFPGVEDLAAQRQDGLELLVARLLGRTTGRVTLDQKQLGTHRVLPGAVRQFARQSRPLGYALAFDLLAGFEAAPGVADCQLRQLHAQFRVRIEPQAECILDHAGNKCRRFTRRQALLGLPRELRLLHFHREHEGNTLPDVLGRQLDPARQQVAELAELTHRIEQALAQAIDVRTTLSRRNQVDVAFLNAVTAFR